MPEMDKIQANCPKELKFNWQTTDSVYIGPGNSRLFLRGVNEDRGDSARGPFAHIIVADEYGQWREPEYIVNEALRPQLLTTKGQFIFASTPPRDLGHKYYEHKDMAMRENRFISRTIHDNESLTKEQIDEACKEVGGVTSAAWRREYLCEPVADPESLVVPEYKEDIHDISDDEPRPSHFDTYVGADLGLNDKTALIFAYYDFMTATLVIDDEWVDSGRNTKEITDAAKEIEARLWEGIPIYKRVGDNALQQLYDMSTLHDYTVLPSQKQDKLAAINALRIRFKSGRIKIRKRCKHLRFQLKVGMWNTSRSSFERGDETGHLDAIDALVYLNRNLNVTHNPYPSNVGVSHATHFVPNQANPLGNGERSLIDLYRK